MSGTLLSRGFLRGSLIRTGSRVLPAVARTDPYRSHRRSIFDISFADAPSTKSTTPSISLARTTGKRELKVEAATVAAAPAALTFTLTPAHGCVALSVVFAVFVHNIYMNVGVARARCCPLPVAQRHDITGPNLLNHVAAVLASIHPSIYPSIHPSIHPSLPSLLFVATPPLARLCR